MMKTLPDAPPQDRTKERQADAALDRRLTKFRSLLTDRAHLRRAGAAGEVRVREGVRERMTLVDLVEMYCELDGEIARYLGDSINLQGITVGSLLRNTYEEFGDLASLKQKP